MAGDEDDQAQYAALEREMSQPDAELGNLENVIAGEPERYEPEPQPQPQPRHAEPQPQPRQYQQTPQPQPQPREGPPDVDEDPISHFQWRAALNEHRTDRAEQELITRDFLTQVDRSEAQLRNDLEDPTEYDDACDYLRAHRAQEIANMYPDTQHTLALARQHNYQSPAHMRHAILQNDIMEVAANAIRQGVPPAQAYYNHATARGFRRRSDALKSEMRAVLRNTENVGNVAGYNSPHGKAFDAWFDQYSRVAKQREQFPQED